MNTRYILLGTAALIGTTPIAALAQTAATAETAAPESADQTTSTQGIGDIIVTAERRAETVQKSSLSIEVFSGDKLANVTRPSDLTSLSPGVQVSTSGPTPQVYIRGVGDPAANSRSQSAVAFSVDNVYIGRATQVGPQMFDIARLEVLKGPQGTLYGRNTSGGAVNIITNNPKLGEVSGYVSGEIGNLDLQSGTVAINLPIGSNVAVRLAGQIIDRSGYTSNGGQDQKVKSARVKLLWEPSDSVSLLLSADASHIGGQGSGVVLKTSKAEPATGSPWRDVTDTPLPYPFLFGPGTAPFTAPNDRFIDSDARGVSGELNADLGFATLTVIPAYRYQDMKYVSYSSNFRFWEGIKDKQTSLETRLGNDGPAFKWVAGFYYFRESQDMNISPFSSARLSGFLFDQATKAYAGFAQATATVTTGLRVIGGIRHTKEEIGGNYQLGTYGPPIVPFIPTGPVVGVGPLKYSKTNFKLGFEYDLAQRSMLYATYATGFKGGGYAQTVSCGAEPFEAETVKALTVGLRNRFADNRIQLNVEGFYWKYKDQQITFVGLDRCGGTTLVTRNPGDATIKGANAEIVAKPYRNGTLRFAVEYNDATYDDFILTQLGQGAYAPSGGTRCTSAPAGGGLFAINCGGQRISRTPKWSGSVGYQHIVPLESGGEIDLSADMQFASQRWIDFNYIPNAQDNAYQMYNAQIIWKPTDAYSIGLFMNNITNAAVYTGGASVPQLAPNGSRLFAANIMAPRTYGVRARVNF